MNTPFDWHWDYDRGETLADAVIHILGIALAIAGAAALAKPALMVARVLEKRRRRKPLD